VAHQNRNNMRLKNISKNLTAKLTVNRINRLLRLKRFGSVRLIGFGYILPTPTPVPSSFVTGGGPASRSPPRAWRSSAPAGRPTSANAQRLYKGQEKSTPTRSRSYQFPPSARHPKGREKFPRTRAAFPCINSPIASAILSGSPFPHSSVTPAATDPPPPPRKWAARAGRLGFPATPTPTAARRRGPPLRPPPGARASTR